MEAHPLVIFAAAIALAWFMLRKNPQIGATIGIVAPLMIAAILIWEFGVTKTNREPLSVGSPDADTSKLQQPALAVPAISTDSFASVRSQGEINMRQCAGSECQMVAQLQRSGRVKLLDKETTVETLSGARYKWVLVETVGSSYCHPDNLRADQGCTQWQIQPSAQGWVNFALLRE